MKIPIDFYSALQRLIPDKQYDVTITPSTGAIEHSNLYGKIVRNENGFAFIETEPEAPTQPKRVQTTTPTKGKKPTKKPT
jgi:hypothetical protein